MNGVDEYVARYEAALLDEAGWARLGIESSLGRESNRHAAWRLLDSMTEGQRMSALDKARRRVARTW